VHEGLRISFDRPVDSYCSRDPRGHQGFLNAACCKCVGDPGVALYCCCYLHV